MLTLTKKTDYALIALSLLAQRSDRVVSARTIAEDSGVPLSILTNILQALSQSGMIASERGPNGGYRLARLVSEISMHEVVTIIEGPIQFVRCMPTVDNKSANACDLEECCPVRIPAHRIHERLERFLEGVTLAELMEPELESSQVLPVKVG